SGVAAFAVATGFISFWPLVTTLINGQVSLALLIAWLTTVELKRRSREEATGANLAILLVKPTFVVLPVAILAAQGRWAAVRIFLSIAALLVLVSVVVAGPESLWRYPAGLLNQHLWDSRAGEGASQPLYGWNGLVRVVSAPGTTFNSVISGALAVGTVVV